MYVCMYVCMYAYVYIGYIYIYIYIYIKFCKTIIKNLSPADIFNVKNILKEYGPEQRRDIMPKPLRPRSSGLDASGKVVWAAVAM